MADHGISVEDVTAKQAADLISKEAPAQLRRYVLAHPDMSADDPLQIFRGRPRRRLLQGPRDDGSAALDQQRLARSSWSLPTSCAKPVSSRSGFNPDFFIGAGCIRHPPGGGRSRRRHPRLGLHDARRARAVAPDRRRRLDLSRGVRAAEPLDRPDRGQHRQPCGGAVDRLRHPRPGDLHQFRRVCRNPRRSSAGWC